MCLYIDRDIHGGKRPRAKIAKEDIPVCKVIAANNESLHRKFKYTRRKTYQLQKSLRVKRLYDDHVIEEGFHAYVITAIKKSVITSRPSKVVRFTIPKGAKYFIGYGEEIVSDKIRAGELRPLKGRA